jgi:RNA polymerase sigma-70 factor (ECF subfamily)
VPIDLAGAAQDWLGCLGKGLCKDGEFGVPSGVSYLQVSGGVGERAREEDANETLVALAQRGDRAAFGRLYQRYARMVHGILLARLPNAEVDDLVQDVFVQAMRQVHTLREVTRFGGWLAAVARNRANDFHRRSVEQVEWREEAHGGEAPRSVVDDGTAILEAIRGLPEAYRETLILRLVEGMTGPEIAERTGLKTGSVRVNLHRGMQMLRKKLG